jgi:predicted aspartyl protease
MPANLAPPLKNPADPRPHQKGKITGYKAGTPVTARKEWLVDTGAQITCVTKNNADQFDLTPTGGSASATTGGGGILVKTGLTVWFEVFDKNGQSKSVGSQLSVAVKPNNNGSEILGMDQLQNANAAIEWDTAQLTGRLYEP